MKTDILQDITIAMNIDEEQAEEYVIKGYIEIRLNPLEGVVGISKDKLRDITDLLYNNFIDYDYTIDKMVNAIYNYINKVKYCPSKSLLTDNIEILLKNYAN